MYIIKNSQTDCNEIILETTDDANTSATCINLATLTNSSVFYLYIEMIISNDLKNKLLKIFNRTTLIKGVVLSNGTKDILVPNINIFWEDTATNLKIHGSMTWNQNKDNFNTNNANLKIKRIIY